MNHIDNPKKQEISPNSTYVVPGPMSSFLSRYDEERFLKQHAKDNRQEKKIANLEDALPRGEIDPVDEIRQSTNCDFIEQKRQEKRMIEERLKIGFMHKFPRQILGRERLPFIEPGLRSEGYHSTALRYFVACTPKAGRIRVSMNKGDLFGASSSKLLALDMPYIEMNRDFLSAIRIDIDKIFPSVRHCKSEIEDIVRQGKIACMPHIITGDELDDGRYVRPHLYFMLPYQSAVWNKPSDKRCNMTIVRFFESVSRGIVNALLPIGADPAAPTLTMRGKNPLSPYLRSVFPNDTHFPTLSEHSEYVDTRTHQEILTRKAVSVQTGLALKASNSLFDSLRKKAYLFAADWYFNKDPRMGESIAHLADNLHVALTQALSGSETPDIQTCIVIGKIADFVAFNFDPAKMRKKQTSRGRYLHEMIGLNTLKDRQACSGKQTSNMRSDETREKLTSIMISASEMDQTLNQTQLASRSGYSRQTVIRHWNAIRQGIPNSSKI